jgi:hypothetical protein
MTKMKMAGAKRKVLLTAVPAGLEKEEAVLGVVNRAPKKLQVHHMLSFSSSLLSSPYPPQPSLRLLLSPLSSPYPSSPALRFTLLTLFSILSLSPLSPYSSPHPSLHLLLLAI